MKSAREWKGTPSWWNYLGRLSAAFCLCVVSMGLLFSQLEYKGPAAAVSALLALGCFLSACWSKFSNRYSVSGGTVSATYGLLSIETHEVDVRDIQDVVLKQSLLGRILNYGTVEFSSAGRDQAEVIFDGVPDPKRVKDLVMELKREALKK